MPTLACAVVGAPEAGMEYLRHGCIAYRGRVRDAGSRSLVAHRGTLLASMVMGRPRDGALHKTNSLKATFLFRYKLSFIPFFLELILLFPVRPF